MGVCSVFDCNNNERKKITRDSSFHKFPPITPKTLNVVQAERQNVKHATKLFSHTVAKALSRSVGLGYLEDESWEECYQQLKYTNDWFDVMNVWSPYSDSRERVHAYGLHLETQNKILDEMSDMILNMRVVGKKCLLPFQKVDNSMPITSEPEENLPFAYDGLENLAGHICHRFKNIIQNLDKIEPDEISWVNHLYKGSLSKAIPIMMAHFTALENVFT